MPTASLVMGILLGVALAAMIGAAAYAAAARIIVDQLRVRWAVAAVLGLAIAGLAFALLAELEAFSAGPVFCFVAGALALAVAAAGRDRLHAAWRDDRRAAAWLRTRRGWIRWIVAMVAVVVAIRFGRALVAPPMATDALTYHLFRAGQWVQTAGRGFEPAPDAWGYYAYYPHIGDGLWALAMLPTRSDALLVVPELLVFALIGFGGFALARALSASRKVAALAGLTIVTCPSVFSFATAAYVDNLVLAMTLLAIALLAECERGGRPVLLGPAVLGAAMAAAVKTTGIPVFALTISAALAIAVRRRGGALAIAIGFALAVPLIVGAYGPGWIDHGNPLYPFGFHFGALEWAGNEENELLQTGALAPASVTQFSWLQFLGALFVPPTRLGVQALNPGPLAPVVLALGVWGAARGRGPLVTKVLLALLAATFVARLASDSSLAHRTFAAPAVGRFLTIPWAALVVLATAVPRRVFTVVTTTAIAVGCVLSFPQGVAAWEWPWIAASAAALAALGAALVLACVPLRWRAGIIAAVGVVSIALVGPARDALRYRFYAGAVAARNFDPHPTDQHVAEAWPIWQALDRDTPSTIAFAAGWDRRGHNWYRYPLLGSRLQNHVTYVPVTKDGSIVDYRERDRLLRSVHVPSWLEGLAERRVDTLVLGHPTTIETVIVQQLPALFELEVSAGSNRAYRVDRDRLRRALEDSRSHRSVLSERPRAPSPQLEGSSD